MDELTGPGGHGARRLLRVVVVCVTAAVICGGLMIRAAVRDFSPCRNSPVATYRSPDGQRKIVVFGRDCGATTGLSTQATLLPVNVALSNEAGSVFVADTDHGAAPSAEGGGPEVQVVWISTMKAVLRTHEKTRVFLKEPMRDGVDFEYETLK